ncbi:HDIG domain-containing metalloprotein [uncultured Thermanaerothrix sp.]|uniref:HD family phosphohydrolase n=1 Tax=uncultured Thermanaerothrix sp. TaxID=1195149 RepID=UPI0026117986|nr:HDIG domain-containing metalloprotein [uncultured Thermanaerothrix sp.]
MKTPSLPPTLVQRLNRMVIKRALLVLCSLLSLGALLFPIAIRPPYLSLKVGDVASQDILAPKNLTFVSEVLTRQAQEEARKSVAPVYLPPDPSITRRQIEKLQLALNYITTVRYDPYAAPEQKIEDLQALADIPISEQTARLIIDLNDNQWQTIQQEALLTLEQVMRGTIREDRLEEARQSVPGMISFTLPEEQARIVADLVTPLVQPNSLYSETLTERAREEAAKRVEPVTRSYLAGEVIVRRGQLITPVVMEALEKFGLVETENRYREIAGATALVASLSVFIGLYFTRQRAHSLESLKALLLLAFTFLVFLYAARIVIPNRVVVPYLFPLPAFALTVASLYSLEIGLVFSLVLSLLSTYNLPNALGLFIFYLLTSLMGILALGKARRVANFFGAGIAIGLTGSAMIIAFRLPDPFADWIGITTLVGSSFINGIASASLTLLLQFLFSQALGVITPLQLLDLLRPDHSLLQFVLRNAPGSYQHSLQVANLAEQAAEAIGADTLLTRVGAIYHDIGKAVNPAFFIENQVQGKTNPHNELDPYTSADIIIRHVEDGVQLARKHRLPPRIIDFIREHHGTLIARYQYARALEAAGNDPTQVDVQRFRYPGPPPQSRETALLMLADMTEARARAEMPTEEEEFRNLVRKAIEYCQRERQLDQTNLTLRDFYLITESFTKTLLNAYHPRIKYPEVQPFSKSAGEQATQPIESPSPLESHTP